MVFETWLENCLRTTLKAGQVLIMDNATFHKGGRISQLIEDAGCQLLYLPPYSPDLNKIEQCWSWLKSRIRKQLDQFDFLLHATLECLAFCVLTAGRGCYIRDLFAFLAFSSTFSILCTEEPKYFHYL
jgi:transposase